MPKYIGNHHRAYMRAYQQRLRDSGQAIPWCARCNGLGYERRPGSKWWVIHCKDCCGTQLDLTDAGVLDVLNEATEKLMERLR